MTGLFDQHHFPNCGDWLMIALAAVGVPLGLWHIGTFLVWTWSHGL